MEVMSAVAEQLRQAREAKHLTVQQVVEIMKIRADHLRALEEGNFDVFSAPVYIRGFVRGYSNLLKLDVPQVMAALDNELAQTTKFSEPPPLSEHPRGVIDFVMLRLSQVDWRKALVVLGTIIVIGGAVWAWAAWRQHNPLKGLKPALYQSPQSGSGDTLPLPTPRH